MEAFLLLFFVINGSVGLLLAVLVLAGRFDKPFPRENPRRIFRLVHREDRASYVRIMRPTYAVAMRDLGRSIRGMQRAIGKALLPALRHIAAFLDSAFREPR